MQNTAVRVILIVLAVVGALTLVGMLAMALGCGMMSCGSMMGGMMGGMGRMMGSGLVGVLLAMIVIAAIVALVVFRAHRK